MNQSYTVYFDFGHFVRAQVTRRPASCPDVELTVSGAVVQQPTLLNIASDVTAVLVQYGDLAGFGEGEAAEYRLEDALVAIIEGARAAGAEEARAEMESSELISRHVAAVREEFVRERNRLRDFVVARDGEQCRVCGAIEFLSIDHDIPVSQGGDNDPSNLVMLCQSCNSRKGNRPHLQVVRSQGE